MRFTENTFLEVICKVHNQLSVLSVKQEDDAILKEMTCNTHPVRKHGSAGLAE